MCIYIYIYDYVYVTIHIYIYIYTYIERERERERKRYIHIALTLSRPSGIRRCCSARPEHRAPQGDGKPCSIHSTYSCLLLWPLLITTDTSIIIVISIHILIICMFYHYHYGFCKHDFCGPELPGRHRLYRLGANLERGGEGTADWDAVASDCSTGNSQSSFHKRISSKSSKWETWAQWGFPTVSSPLPKPAGEGTPRRGRPRLPTTTTNNNNNNNSNHTKQ